MENGSAASLRLGKILRAMEHIHALHDGNDEVQVPGIVVAGEQSAGKSSLLEGLGGIKLPRGQGITTRVPLILSLQAVPGADRQARIGNNPDEMEGRVVELADIPDAITDLTVELAGEDSGVSDNPIYLRVTGDSLPTLTLIDLPGISQRSDEIHTKTLALVRKYMENKNTVILAVMPAMSDFDNSEALKEALLFDPDGRRTLGVVTKTDNVRPGCGILAKLRMQAGRGRLHLGFIAVVNRTPTEQDVSAEEVREKERRTFSTNPELVGLEKEYWGLDTLVERVVEIQKETVEKFVPEYLVQASRRISELRKELSKLPLTLTTDNQLWDAYHKTIYQVIDWLNSMLNMRADKALPVPVQNIIPHVVAMYREYASKISKEIPDFFDDGYHDEVKAEFHKVDGMGLSNLLSARVFDNLFQSVFRDHLSFSSEQLVGRVKRYMEDVLGTLCEQACKGYPALHRAFKTSLVEDFMEAKEAKAKEAIGSIVEAELQWVFTQDRKYEETIQAVNTMATKAREQRAVSNALFTNSETSFPSPPAEAVEGIGAEFVEKMVNCQDTTSTEGETYDLQVTLYAYSKVVCRRTFDVVPKQVHFFLVQGICNGFEDWMMKNATTSDLKEWFAEDAQSRCHRRELEHKLSQYQEGKKILQNARS